EHGGGRGGARPGPRAAPDGGVGDEGARPEGLGGKPPRDEEEAGEARPEGGDPEDDLVRLPGPVAGRSSPRPRGHAPVARVSGYVDPHRHEDPPADALTRSPARLPSRPDLAHLAASPPVDFVYRGAGRCPRSADWDTRVTQLRSLSVITSFEPARVASWRRDVLSRRGEAVHRHQPVRAGRIVQLGPDRRAGCRPPRRSGTGGRLRASGFARPPDRRYANRLPPCSPASSSRPSARSRSAPATW